MGSFAAIGLFRSLAEGSDDSLLASVPYGDYFDRFGIPFNSF